MVERVLTPPQESALDRLDRRHTDARVVGWHHGFDGPVVRRPAGTCQALALDGRLRRVTDDPRSWR